MLPLAFSASAHLLPFLADLINLSILLKSIAHICNNILWLICANIHPYNDKTKFQALKNVKWNLWTLKNEKNKFQGNYFKEN